MKTTLTLLTILFTTITSIAQNGINYKAVIKDDLGNVVVNQTIDVQFIILQGATNVYQETHSPTTDDNGIVIINIGEGTTSDVFTDVDWGGEEHFLNVKINIGSGFIDLGTTQFSAVPYAFHAKKAANVNGLEAIDEGNGIGWRLVGRDPNYYGNIGEQAIDLSYSYVGSITFGATGIYSAAMGFSTIASGNASTALGDKSEASGSASTAMGLSTTATGIASTAMGSGTTASGLRSTAIGTGSIASGFQATAFGHHTEASGSQSLSMGVNSKATNYATSSLGNETTASGYVSTALGDGVTASGNYSTAMGYYTTAPSYAETVIGRYNTTYLPNSSNGWNSSDRLFVIGNGGISSRSNAMVVLKNGNIGIGVDNPQEILHVSGRLRIGTETIEDTGSNRLSFNASLIPDADNAMSLGASGERWTSVWAIDGTINTSDRRDKTNITSLNYGLEEVMKLDPVSFNWKNNSSADKKLGLIAQDLLQVIPEVVKTHEAVKINETGKTERREVDRLGVYYSDLVPVLVKAIQEQQEIIDDQNSKLKHQDSKINDLSAEVNQYQTLELRVKQLEAILNTQEQ